MQQADQYEASPDLKRFVKGTESLVLQAYPDPKTGGDPWTIGYGHTSGVHEGMVWSLEQSETAFEADLNHFEKLVQNNVHVPVTQGQYDALVSIVFNVGPGGPNRDGIIRLRSGGPSTLLRKLNEGDYEGAGQEFLKWVSPGSNVERGLRIRRTYEHDHFWNSSV